MTRRSIAVLPVLLGLLLLLAPALPGLRLAAQSPSSPSAVAYQEDFESYRTPGEPPGWVDTNPGKPHQPADGLFKTWPDPLLGADNTVFGTKGAAEAFTHLQAISFTAAEGFFFEGRLLRTHERSEIGLSIFSSFPDPPVYYLLAQRADTGTVTLSAAGAGPLSGTLDSGLHLEPDTWYRFVVQAFPEAGGLRIRARLWRDGEAEPEGWVVDAVDVPGTGAPHPTGWIGLWGRSAGEKYWDDLEVIRDPDPPVITVRENGEPLADGALFNRTAVPEVTVEDATPVTVDLTLDGAPFVSGTPVADEGVHHLSVTATDAVGNRSEVAIGFTIDLTPPRFLAVSPADDLLTAASQVVIEGQVEGADFLSLGGASVPLSGQSFRIGPLDLTEGPNLFVLVARDAAGNAASVSLRILRDSHPPVLAFSDPSPGEVVGSSPTTAAGTADDPHLASVTVDGRPAVLSSSNWTAGGIPLAEGPNTLTAVAVDGAGNTSQASVGIVLDTHPPTVRVLESGVPLVDGTAFNRTVTPVVEATDATALTVEIRLDGSPFLSGTPVEAEGSYRLDVTATDAAGNATTRSVRFAIDLTPPEILDLDPADGTLLQGATVTIRGRVEGGVGLTVDGASVPLVGGSFTAGPLPLAEGENTFDLVAVDAAGNRARRTLHLERDATPPVVTVATPEAGAVVATPEIAVSGTAADPHLAAVRVNGAPADLVGESFTLARLPLAEGENGIEVVAVDAVGNTAQVDLTVTLDTQPPVVRLLESGEELVDGALFNRAAVPTIEVTDATATHVEALLDGAVFTSGTSVDAEGQHVLSATATDAAGNRASAEVSFEIDATPPGFADVSPADGTVLAAASVTLQGTVRGATAVTVDGAAAALSGDSFSAGPFPLAEGERTFALAAVDAAGNRAEESLHLVRDSTPPSVAVSQPAEGAAVGTPAISVSGTAQDPHLAAVTVNGIEATLTGTSFLARQVPLTEGENHLTVEARDAAGNTAQAVRTAVLDTQAPSVTITDPADGTLLPDTSVTVRGTAADADLERVEVDGVEAARSGDVWSATVPLVEGPNDLVARAVDRFGRSAEATVTVSRDSTAPAITIDEPAEGARLRSETVTVRGSVDADPGITVTVAGQPAVVSGGTFSAADVPLAEGENRLVARAVDAAGNQGARTRMVTRDTTPPELTGSDPVAGALAIAGDTAFRLTFSEEMASPAAASWRLETATGEALASQATSAGTTVTVLPSAPLPSGTDLRLVLTAALTDLAGNPLADPPTLSFTTGDRQAPATPRVEPPPPSRLCAPAVTLGGSAEPGSLIEVAGGASTVQATADGTGSFALAVPLVPAALNHLAVVAADVGGNRSAAVAFDVLQDCQAPVVVAAEEDAGSFLISFSEAVDPASLALAGAVTVAAGSGPLAGDVSLAGDGRSALWTPAAPLPTGPVRLDVSQAVHDLAGNPLAYPFSRLFGVGPEESFLAGAVIDDGVGRPLAGARVTVISTDGQPLAEPRPEETTGVDGRFLLPLPAGTHDLAVRRPGYTPVFRVVTTVAGQGTDVFDPRPTPAAAARDLGTAGGTFDGADGLSLSLPQGALVASTPVAVTPLGEQGLPALLPYGWSPRGAAWVDLGGAELAASATLRLPVDAADGTLLVFAALDEATLQWRAVRQVPVEGGTVTATIAGAGGFAALQADAGAFAPPPVVEGELLGSAPRPAGGEVLSAALAFDPELVLPSQRSRVTVRYTLAEEVASGLPLTLVVGEELELLDGTVRREAPYGADLVLYHDAGGQPRSRFSLRPSGAAQSLPLRVGAEEVALRPYGGETVRGNVLGPDGGAVVSADGDRVEVAAGALDAPLAVTLERRAAADLPLPVPAGTTFAGLLDLDLGGHTLVVPAGLTLELGTDSAPAAGEHGLLFAVLDTLAGPALRPVDRLEPTASGWRTAAIDPQDLPWPGVRNGGLYLFVRSDSDLAFLRGTVFDVDGVALPGAVVSAAASASVGGATLPWVQLAGVDGRYALPVPLGPWTVAAENPATLNRGEAVASPAVADARVDLDLLLRIVAAEVVTTTPVDGDSGVPAGVEPVVRFSEPVERASLAGGIELLENGQPVAVSFDHQGALVTVVPMATLAPGAAVELRVGSGIRDLQGNALTRPVTVRFTTAKVLGNQDLDLDLILLVEPDAGGLAAVRGLAGAVPAGTLVFVENTTSLAATPSVTASQDGSFDLQVAASLDDRLLLHVLVEGGNEVVAELGPFLAADLQSAFVDARGGRFTTSEGVTVIVPPGALEAPTRVRLTLADPTAPPPAPVPPDFIAVAAFNLAIGEAGGGAELAAPIEVRLPAPAGLGDGQLLLDRLVTVFDQPRWMLHDLVRLDGGALTTEEAPAGSGSALAVEAATSRLGGDGGTAAASQLVPKTRPALLQSPKVYVPGASLPGFYQIVQAQVPLGFVALPFAEGFSGTVLNDTLGMVTLLNAQIERYLAADAVLIPTRLDQDLQISVVDPGSGQDLFAGIFPAPGVPGEVVPVPPATLGDVTPPTPVGGSPVRLDLIEDGGAASSEIEPGIFASELDNTLTVHAVAGTVTPGVRVELVALDGSGAEAQGQVATDGSFQLAIDASAGGRFLLAVGARLAPDQPLELDFDEAIAEGFPGIDVLTDVGGTLRSVGPEIVPVGTRAHLRIRPPGGWQAGETGSAGKTYVLHLGPELADVAGNEWGTTLDLELQVESSEALSVYPSVAVRDVARLGSLLFLAADTKGLVVVDTSRPDRVDNLVAGDVTFPFPLGDPVRGVAVDAHGRVLVVGGGVQGPGQMKIFDPLALDPQAIAADAGDPAVRYAAFKGSTLLSDPLGAAGGSGTELPEGTPRRVAVLSDDDTVRWRAGGTPPTGVTVDPATLPQDGSEVEITVSGSDGTPGAPVSLRDRAFDGWNRVDAAADGSYSVSLRVRAGDPLELARNRVTLAYVATLGVGIEVVDVNAFYNEMPDGQTPGGVAVTSDVIGIYSGFGDPALTLCGEPVSDLGSLLSLGTLFDVTNPHPLALAGLAGFRGLLLLESDTNDPGRVSFVGSACAELDGSRNVADMTILQGYGFDLDGDGVTTADEVRDYALVSHRSGAVLFFDVTDRENPEPVGLLRLPGPATELSVDRRHRRLYAGFGQGVYIADLDRAPTLKVVDADGDGVDDRLLETVNLAGDTSARVGLAPELGLAYAGGLEKGLSSVAVGGPSVAAVAPSGDGFFLEVAGLAPEGLPKVPEVGGITVGSTTGAASLESPPVP